MYTEDKDWKQSSINRTEERTQEALISLTFFSNVNLCAKYFQVALREIGKGFNNDYQFNVSSKNLGYTRKL